jgi:hypothetical protein
MKLKDNATIGELYGSAMAITDAREAATYFEALVERSMARGHSREEAEDIERANLGYYAGYGSAETRERVEGLFGCSHPVFGKVEENGQPGPMDAYNAEP